MKIVAIGHQKGVGKSTFAKFLVTILRMKYPGKSIKTVAFADGVKDISYQLFGWLGLKEGNYYENNYKEKEVPLECGLTPRDIWIGVGNKMREIDVLCWIKNSLNIDCDILIVTDLRYCTEAIELTKMGACLIRLSRVVPRGDDPAEIDMLDWTDWCFDLFNNGTLADLYKEAEKVARYLE